MKTNYMDDVLTKDVGLSQHELRQFKMEVATETRRLFTTSKRGACKLHTEIIQKQFPHIKNYFPKTVDTRVEKTNPDTGKRFYVLVPKELEFDTAIQQWSTTICNGIGKLPTKVKAPKAKVKSKSDAQLPLETLENTFKMDVSYNPPIVNTEDHDLQTVFLLIDRGAKQVDTPSGYKVHF